MERYYGELMGELASAETYTALADAAIRVLRKMRGLYSQQKTIVQVCGPMSTGGLGSVQENMTVFTAAIRQLDEARYHTVGEVVFDQIPCQDAIVRIMRAHPIPGGGYDERILTHFYAPLFRAGVIKRCYFLPGWESSHGASWERGIVSKHGIEICDYPDDLYERVLQQCGLTSAAKA
jgi:putative component of membrane protein insertase Oxa1/YidC/SpoIIIJ protein YidD